MTSSSAAFPDAEQAWNQRYAGDDYLFGREPNAWLREQAGVLSPGSRVLCVADGEGRNSVWLARQGHRVEAFDISPVAVEKARRLAAGQGAQVDFHVADCESWAWQQAAYDAVVAIFIQFVGPAERERLFARMAAALVPGGHLLLQGYTPKQLEYKTGGPPEVSHLYTPGLLHEAFGALETVSLRDYEDDLHEGERHVGRSALIGLVARRPAG